MGCASAAARHWSGQTNCALNTGGGGRDGTGQDMGMGRDGTARHGTARWNTLDSADRAGALGRELGSAAAPGQRPQRWRSPWHRLHGRFPPRPAGEEPPQPLGLLLPSAAPGTDLQPPLPSPSWPEGTRPRGHHLPHLWKSRDQTLFVLIYLLIHSWCTGK